MGEMVQGYDRELFNEAVRSARRIARAAKSDDLESSQAGTAAAAIVLAESALEAFVSETLAVLERIGTVGHESRKNIEDKPRFWKGGVISFAWTLEH